MAEYRGLTIKIGADTTSLTASLKGAQSAIASTQKQLRTLKQALKMDSSSTKASALYIGELQSQAVAAASKVAHLSTEMRRLSETTSKVDDAKTIGQLAKDTDNVALSAQRAKQIYQGITADLSRYYTRLSDLASGVVRDFNNGLDSSMSQEERVKEIIENLGALVDENGKALKFDVKRSDIDDIIAAIDELQARGVIKKGEAKKAVAEIKMLKAAFIEASDAYDDARLVQKLHTDTVEAAKLEAQFKSLAEEIADADKGSSLAKRWEEAQQALGILDKDASRAKAHFDALDAAAKIDPTNIDVASARTQALAEAVVLAEGKADALRAVLASYDNRGIGRVAQSTIRAAENVEKWRTEFVDAQTEVNRVESALERARLKVAQLEATGKTNTKAYENATADVAELEVKLDGARQAAEHANAEFRRAKDIAAYKDIETQADEASVAVEKLKETFRKLAEVQVKARPDTELGKSWSKVSEQIKRFGDDIDRASERVDALDAQMKIDPENLDLAAAKSKAMGEALTIAESKAASLSSTLDSYRAQGIDKAAAGITSVSDNLDQAEQNAIEATARVNELELELKQLDDAKVDAKGEAWFELSRKWRETTEALYAARRAAEQANDELDRAKDIAAYENVRTQLEKATAAADEYRDAMVQADKVSLADGMREFTVAIDGLDADIAAAKREFEALDKAAKLDPSDLDLARERTDALRKVTDLTYQKSSELSRALGEYKSAGIDKVAQGTEKLSESAAKATQNYRNSLDRVGELRTQLLAAYDAARKLGEENPDSDEYRVAADQVDKLGDELAEAVGSSKQLRSEMLELNAAVQYNDTAAAAQQVKADIAELEGMGRRSTESISTASVLILQEVGQLSRQVVSSVSTATYDLEEAYTNMRKTVNATDEEYEQLKESAIQASLVQPVSADQILNVEALGGQLDFAVDELEEFQRVANGLDISTNMSWEDAATDMAKFANIMKMNHSDVGRYGSAIVDLGNNFATTEADISDMAMRIAGAGASMELSSADVLGLATALTSMGLTAEAGGSSISQIMVKVDKAVANGTAGIEEYANKVGMSVSDFIETVKGLEGDDLTNFAKQFETTGSQLVKDTVDQVEALKIWADTAGMTSDEFVSAWENEPIKALESLFSGMEQAGEAGTNLNILLEKLGINTIRQSDVARRLANNSELVTRAVEASNAAWEENTALDTEVERRNESLSGRMDVLKNSLTAIKTELGEGLSPIVDIATRALQGVVKVLDGIPNGIKSNLIVITSLVGAVSTATPIIEMFGKKLGVSFGSITSIVGKLRGLSGGVFELEGSIAGLTPALGGLMTSLTFVGGALVAFVAGALINNFMKAKKAEDDHRKSAEALRNEFDRLGGSTTEVSVRTDKLKDSYTGLKTAGITIDDLTEKFRAYNDTQIDSQVEARATVANLDTYKSVLDELVPQVQGLDDASQMSAEAQSKLQWALDGLNEALGTNYTLEDLLRGTYEDEEGNISSLITHIDELIAKRQEEARMKVAQTRLDDAYKLQQEAYQALIDANNEYNQSQQQVMDKAEELQQRLGYDQATAFAEAERIILGSSGVMEQKKQDLDLYAEAYKAATDEVTAANNYLANTQALENLGSNVDEVTQKLMDMGVYADLLSTTTPKDFATIAEECNGDIDLMIQKLLELNGVEPEVDVEVDGAEEAEEALVGAKGTADELDGTVAQATVIADDQASGKVEAAKEVTLSFGNLDPKAPRLDVYNGQAMSAVDAARDNIMNYDALTVKEKRLDGDETDILDSVRNALDSILSVPSERTTTFYANVNPALEAMNWLSSRIGGFVSSASATIAAKFSGNAEGGLIYHADGFIANKPTFITSRDIVGEAGAEAVIPLTNRKYVQPFADTVADGILSKMDGGTHVTVNLNYSAGEDANQLARDLARAISMHKATRGRW